MKKHLSFYALLCTLLFTTAPSLVAQCTIPVLDIKDSVTIKALKIYINTTDARNLKREGKYIDKKSTIVLVEEKQIHQTDGRTLKVLEVNMAQMNYYKHWKMSIIGYFYIDKVLFLVTSPFMGLFTTKNYDYDNCLSQVLQNHSIREYDAPKRIKKIFHNQEVEMKELGESIDHYQARITINLLDKNSKEPYILQYYR